jgi:hypothetical protein
MVIASVLRGLDLQVTLQRAVEAGAIAVGGRGGVGSLDRLEAIFRHA